jgi:hypothetical protein
MIVKLLSRPFRDNDHGRPVCPERRFVYLELTIENEPHRFAGLGRVRFRIRDLCTELARHIYNMGLKRGDGDAAILLHILWEDHQIRPPESCG